MDTAYLATKLRIPPPPPHAVPRPRLLAAIEEGIRAARLVLLSAPAGYGKTALLAQWARATALPVAWLTVDEGDNDPDGFFRYLLGAWETIRPGIRDTRFGILLSGPDPDREQLLAALIQTASEMPADWALVIDEAHLIHDQRILDALTFLLDHMPPTLHLVAACRSDPPLAFARRRARGELLELRAPDLQLDADEAARFLGEGMGLSLDAAEVAALNEQLEGWATGLQLVGLTLRQPREPGTMSIPAGGRHRHVVDYLTEEVLARLPAGTRSFLLQTSILDRLCDSLCVAVTGNHDSQAMLESLERANLFLVPLDDTRTWFRYHRVFADFLRQALAREDGNVAPLHARAATWHLGHELPEPAFQHALAANDIDLVSRVVEIHAIGKMFGGEASTVIGWFEAIPGEWLERSPRLMVEHAAFRLLMGQPEIALGIMRRLEELPHPEQPEKDHAMARVDALRCFMACFQHNLPAARENADRAFERLPADDFVFRANLYHALGDTYRSHGLWDDARAHYLKVLENAPKAAYDRQIRIITVHSYGGLADLELRQGHLRAAGAYWARALETVQQRNLWGRYPLPVTGWIYLRLGELAYERHELEAARDFVDSGRERVELGGEPLPLIAGKLVAARLALTDGRLDDAASLLDGAQALLADTSFPDWQARCERLRVDLWLAQGKLREALRWANKMLAVPGDESQQEARLLAVARVLVEGTDPTPLDTAAPLLERLVEAAAAQGLQGVQIEALTLRAMLRDRRGDHAGMLTSLEQALRLAEPEGYARLFVDLGPHMRQLLAEARRRDVKAGYVTQLLAACGDTSPFPAARDLPEPLSPREVEVLRLMAAGLSNREIADALYVSPETVKKHTGNIYGKLGVRGRVEAVTRARALDLTGEADSSSA